jgi:hypothetical protein
LLANVTISVAELANLKPVHCKVLAGLLAFADRTGKCWPSLRTLAELVGLKLSRVHRAIAEMESDGILTRTRRGAGTLYQLAERFVWQAIRPRPATPSNRSSEPDCSASGTVSSASGTEGEAKKEIQDLKTKRGSVRLAPPPATPPAEPPQKPPALPVEGPNPFARRQWLRNLNRFIGERLSGPQQWSGWDLVARAEAGALIDRAERRQLDDIDRAMRGCGYRASA